MITLRRTELFHALMDACQQSTSAVLYLEGQNPYRLSFNGTRATVFIGNLHFAARSDADEWRIQCPGDLPRLLETNQASGDIVCILGYHADLGVFSAWDPSVFLHRNPMTQRFSLYTRLSSVQRARTAGFAKYVDTDQHSVLLFRSEYLGVYVENVTVIHRATDKTLRTIARVYDSTRPGSRPSRRITVARKRIKVTRSQFARSPRFRKVVLSAYGHRCAVCGLQMELVEAAHIVPHAHRQGKDVVENGLALCALHHKSFDQGLIFADHDYSIQTNDDRIEYLAKKNLVHGLTQFTRGLRSSLSLPKDVRQYPQTDNIILGNQLRGIGVG